MTHDNTVNDSEKNNAKAIRDKLAAFAFTAADFLLEIDKYGNIMFSSGKAHSLTGYSNQELFQQNWLKIFSTAHHVDLNALVKGAQKAGRIGPILVNLQNRSNNQKAKAMITGMTVPESSNIFLTINASQSFFDFIAMQQLNDEHLLDEKEFEESAVRAFAAAKKEGKKLDITFLETEDIEKYKSNLPSEVAMNFNASFNALLKEQSYEGSTASQVEEGRYAIVHDRTITPEFIERKIQELMKRSLPEFKGEGIKTKTVEADMEALTEREARRALIYTINQIEKNGLESVGNDLKKGFDDYLKENASRISRLKKLVGHQSFKLNFQPIVNIPDETLCHYEALIRFDSDYSPYELITFGEEVGLAPDIDISVLRQSIGYVQEAKKKGEHIRLAVNISGFSIQNDHFCHTMLETLKEMKVSSDNLMFEITESTHIESLEKVNAFLQKLRRNKYEVCLDDFGAGSASFQYLNALDIDCVKIDGKYIRDSINSPRDEAMVRNLVRMCKDLKVTTIAEMVENEEQLAYLIKIGADKAQGWLFGKAEPKASYSPRSK